VELDALARLDQARKLLLHRRLQLQRVHLHDRGDRRVLANEFAGLDQPF
jgi:hypothetical protein